MTSPRHRTTEWTIISELTWCLILFLFLFLPSSNVTKGLICQHQFSEHLFDNHLCQKWSMSLWISPSVSVNAGEYCLRSATFSFFRFIVYFPVFFLAWAEVRSESVISHRERVIRWTMRLDQSDWVLLSTRSSNNFKATQSFSDDIDRGEQKKRKRRR